MRQNNGMKQCFLVLLSVLMGSIPGQASSESENYYDQTIQASISYINIEPVVETGNDEITFNDMSSLLPAEVTSVIPSSIAILMESTPLPSNEDVDRFNGGNSILADGNTTVAPNVLLRMRRAVTEPDEGSGAETTLFPEGSGDVTTASLFTDATDVIATTEPEASGDFTTIVVETTSFDDTTSSTDETTMEGSGEVSTASTPSETTAVDETTTFSGTNLPTGPVTLDTTTEVLTTDPRTQESAGPTTDGPETTETASPTTTITDTTQTEGSSVSVPSTTMDVTLTSTGFTTDDSTVFIPTTPPITDTTGIEGTATSSSVTETTEVSTSMDATSTVDQTAGTSTSVDATTALATETSSETASLAITTAETTTLLETTNMFEGSGSTVSTDETTEPATGTEMSSQTTFISDTGGTTSAFTGTTGTDASSAVTESDTTTLEATDTTVTDSFTDTTLEMTTSTDTGETESTQTTTEVSAETSTASQTETTFPSGVFTNDSIVVIALNISGGSVAEQDLAEALAQSYRDIIDTGSAAGRRKRAAVATAPSQDGRFRYTVEILTISPNNEEARFYVIEEDMSNGVSISPTGSFVSGNLEKNPAVVIANLQRNNINVNSVVFSVLGICRNTRERAAIDLQILNEDSNTVSQTIRLTSFEDQLASGFTFLAAFDSNVRCGVPSTSITYEICEVTSSGDCDVTVSFLEASSGSTGTTTIERLSRNSENDEQLYAFALRAYVTRIPYIPGVAVPPTTPATTPQSSTTGINLVPVPMEVLPPWLIPVLVVLAVLCFFLIIALIVLIWYFCFRKKKESTGYETFTGHHEGPAKANQELVQEVSSVVAEAQAVTPAQPPHEGKRTQELKNHPPLPPYVATERPLHRAPPILETPSTDSDTQQQKYEKRKQKRKRPKPQGFDATNEPLFEEVSHFSGETPNDGNTRFQSNLPPLGLPPIHTPLVSEQLRENLKKSKPRPENKKKKPSTGTHVFDPSADEETAEVYKESQDKVDEVLEPKQPAVFNPPPGRKRFHKRQGKANLADLKPHDPELELMMGNYANPPGHFSVINPYESPRGKEKTSPRSGLSPDAARQKIASLLEDAFSLVSPTSPRNTVSPVNGPPVSPPSQAFIMPQAHGRGSSAPNSSRSGSSPRSNPESTSNEPLFTKVQPPLVRTSLSGDGPASLYIPPSETPSGQPAYITPVKKVPGPSGDIGVWTPYRAFDEVSKIREDLENAKPLFDYLPNTPPSSSGNPPVMTSPSLKTSIIDNGIVKLPASSLNSSKEEDSPRSSSSLVQGIKDEIAKLVNLPTPVRPLSPSDNTPRYPSPDDQR